MDQPLRLSIAQCRAFDRYAIDVLGIPGIVLMENAGRGAADLICQLVPLEPHTAPVVSILCGKGNNGGDGFVIARHLSMRGYKVHLDLIAAPPALSGDASVQCQIVERMQLPMQVLDVPAGLDTAAERWRTSAVLVDALLGTGFSARVAEPLASVIDRVNAIDWPVVVAIDVPSGLNADTGQPGGTAIRADHTISLIAEKIGYAAQGAAAYVGEVHVADIGAPFELILSRLEQP